MGLRSFLGGIRIGTIKDGSTANMGLVPATQTATVTFAADGTATTVCNLPPGSQIIDINFDTTTVFNAATTNTIKFGTTSGGAELVAATACGPLGRASFATTAVYSAWATIGTSGATVYATYNQTGTVASAGAGRATIVYVVKNADGTATQPA